MFIAKNNVFVQQEQSKSHVTISFVYNELLLTGMSYLEKSSDITSAKALNIILYYSACCSKLKMISGLNVLLQPLPLGECNEG